MQRPFPNGHMRPFGCNGYATAVAVGQSQRLYSGVGMFNWYYLSSTQGSYRTPGFDLELTGLSSMNISGCHKGVDLESMSLAFCQPRYPATSGPSTNAPACTCIAALSCEGKETSCLVPLRVFSVPSASSRLLRHISTLANSVVSFLVFGYPSDMTLVLSSLACTSLVPP